MNQISSDFADERTVLHVRTQRYAVMNMWTARPCEVRKPTIAQNTFLIRAIHAGRQVRGEHAHITCGARWHTVETLL